MKKLYCTICWQEFDVEVEHNAPSAFRGERLNGYCKGDIRAKKQYYAKSYMKPEPEPLLDLYAVPPLVIK